MKKLILLTSLPMLVINISSSWAENVTLLHGDQFESNFSVDYSTLTITTNEATGRQEFTTVATSSHVSLYPATFTGYIHNGNYLVTDVIRQSGSSAGHFEYNDDGLVTYSSPYRATYTYGENTVTKDSVFGKQITTYTQMPTDMNTNRGESKYVVEYDINGNITRKTIAGDQFLDMQLDGNGNIISIFSEPEGSYHFGSDGSIHAMDYKFIYDDETGKPVSKKNLWTGNIIETYDYTEDGKLKICDADGNNCNTKEYDSLKEYIIDSATQGSRADILDSDFGEIGYVPSSEKKLQDSECTTLGNCVSCNYGFLQEKKCVPSCGTSFKLNDGECDRQRYTPAEAAKVLTDDNNNSVTITFKK